MRSSFLQPLGLAARRRHQLADVIVLLAVHQRVRRAFGDDAAVADHRDAVGEQQRLQHVVGDHHAGQAELVVQPPVILAERVAGQRIERAERLVHQHDARLGRDGAGDADALAFAAGKLGGKTVAMLLAIETHQIEQRVDALGHPRLVPAEQLRRDRDVFRDRHVREQADALEHIADAAAQA